MTSYFTPGSERAVAESMRAAKRKGHEKYRKTCERAVEYMNGVMLDDVRSELRVRAPKRQSNSNVGSRIQPFAMPTTKRFVDEQATLYNRQVHRKLVRVDPDTGDDIEDDTTRRLTALNNKSLDKGAFDEWLQAAHRRALLLRSCGVWVQGRVGVVQPQPFLPCYVHPRIGEGFINKADPEAYAAYEVEISGWDSEDLTRASRKTFASVSADEVRYYIGTEPGLKDEVLETTPNPFEWMRRVPRDDIGVLADVRLAKGNMMTIMRSEIDPDSLLPDTDALVHEVNREINLQLSLIFDTMATQSYAVPVFGVADPYNWRSKLAWGSRNPVKLHAGETADMLQAAVTYGEQMTFFRDLIRLLAVMERMSPNDFSTDGVAPASGFAKLVDSLPKLEQRDEIITRQVHYEEQELGPRVVAAQVYMDNLPSEALHLQWRVSFSELGFPKSEDERAKRIETDVKHNLSTPAEVLSREKGIDRDRADEQIEENRAVNKSASTSVQVPGQPQGGPGPFGAFGRLIARNDQGGKPQQEGADKEEEEDDDEA